MLAEKKVKGYTGCVAMLKVSDLLRLWTTRYVKAVSF